MELHGVSSITGKKIDVIAATHSEDFLRTEMLPPYSKVYLTIRHTTPISVSMSFGVVYKHSLWSLDYHIAKITGHKFDRQHNGLRMTRPDSDRLVYDLANLLHGDPTVLIPEFY